jgi:hypothetical protein
VLFRVTAGRFLGFVVHKQGKQVDPKKVESIKRLGEPTCKKDVQKLLGKVNYLRRFIVNLAGKVESFLPLIQLKHEEGFIWGAEQRAAFEKNQRIPHHSTGIASIKKRQRLQDVYRSSGADDQCSVVTKRRWEGVPSRVHWPSIDRCQNLVRVRGETLSFIVLCMRKI